MRKGDQLPRNAPGRPVAARGARGDLEEGHRHDLRGRRRRASCSGSSPTATCGALLEKHDSIKGMRVGDVMTKNPTVDRAREARGRGGADLREHEPRRAPRGAATPTAASSARSPSTTCSPPGWSERGSRRDPRGARARCASRSSTWTACSPTARSTSAAQGEAFKAFNILDGHGVKMLQAAGVATAILSGRSSEAVARRAAELAIEHVIQGSTDKVADFERLVAAPRRSSRPTCAFVGDDLPDLAVMRRCGLAVAVANAVDAVKAAAHYVTRASRRARRGARVLRAGAAARAGQLAAARGLGTMVRPTSWLPLAALALLVGLTLWLNTLVQPPAARADGKLRHDPDLMVENFNAAKLGRGRARALHARRAEDGTLPRRRFGASRVASSSRPSSHASPG